MSWSGVDIGYLIHNLVRFYFPRQQRQARGAKKKQRRPTRPQWRVHDDDLSNHIKLFHRESAAYPIVSTEQARGRVTHQGKQTDEVSQLRLEKKIDKDGSKNRGNKNDAQHRRARDDAPLQQRGNSL